VVATVSVGDFPVGVTITPDGAHAYVTNFFSDDVSVIETATNTWSPPWPWASLRAAWPSPPTGPAPTWPASSPTTSRSSTPPPTPWSPPWPWRRSDRRGHHPSRGGLTHL
jgi:DNA-binding beta-propeller fold protein YncE